MKITVNELRRIIKEEVGRMMEGEGENVDPVDPWDSDDPSGGYVDPNPMSDEDLKKAYDKSKGDSLKKAYKAFQDSKTISSTDGPWRNYDGALALLMKLNQVIVEVTGGSMRRGIFQDSPLEHIITKHAGAVIALKTPEQKEEYLKNTLKPDPEILKIVNDVLAGLNQEPIPGPVQEMHSLGGPQRPDDYLARIADLEAKKKEEGLTAEEEKLLAYYNTLMSKGKGMSESRRRTLRKR